jgi:hypothetical protein
MNSRKLGGTFIGPVTKEDETSAEQARKKAEKSNARMTWLFTGLTLLVGLFVLGTAGYAIYLQPSNPQPLGTATVEISGNPDTLFSGTVGTLTDEHDIRGEVPITFEVPYKQADYVVTNLEQQGSGALRVRIKAEGETMDEGQANESGDHVVLMWKAPRSTI